MSSTSSPSLHFYTLTMSAVYCYMLCTSPLVNDFVGQRFLLLSSSPNKMDVTRSERLSENCLSCLRVRRTSSQTPKDEIYCHLLSQNCSSTVSSTRPFISTSTGISVIMDTGKNAVEYSSDWLDQTAAVGKAISVSICQLCDWTRTKHCAPLNEIQQ